MRITRTPARISIALCGVLALSACGGGLANSWVNPGNWFGNSRSSALDGSAKNPLIPRPRLGQRPIAEYAGQPVDQISALRVDRLPGGAIVYVSGIADRIGYYDVRLEPENEGKPVKGVLSYTLKAEPPTSSLGVGGEAARLLTAAVSLTEQDLEGVRTIIVRGARNQRSTRR